MRRLALAFLLILLPGLATLASANVCTCTGLCNIASGAGWTGAGTCTDSGGPNLSTDALVVAGGGRLDWNRTGTRTYRYLWIKPGGSVVVSVSPVVMQFNSTLMVYAGVPAFFVVGDVGDSRGTFTSDGKDLTISWVGTGSGVSMNLGPQPFGGQQDPTERYTSVTMRGVERANTRVASYSRGAKSPTPDIDMVDCFDGAVPPNGGAPGDTVVFTTGLSTDYWYEVTGYPDRCTGPGVPFASCTGPHATAECQATACAGGPCDYQVSRNSTGSTPGSVAGSSSWSSMVKTPGNGGPIGYLHRTPDDDDADGVANGDGLLPAVGDAFVVFKPVLIQGRTNPITGGIVVHFTQAGIDWRYVEINKGSGQDTGSCTGGRGTTVLWDTEAKITSPEKAMEFVNLHNFASMQGAWEISDTDRAGDLRPNVPRVYRHFYVHDADPQIGVTCAAEGQLTFGSGINSFIDADDGMIDSVTLDGFHFARWAAENAFMSVDSGVTTNLQIRNVIAHDMPGIPGYGINGTALSFGARGTATVDGAAIWNLGGPGATGASAIGHMGTPAGAPTKAVSIRNAFIVNIDSNTQGGTLATPQGGGFISTVLDYTEDTSRQVISDSYFAKIIGQAGTGGVYRFDFIKNTVMDDDATPPCSAADPRGALVSPVEVSGTVITRDHPLSCMENAVLVAEGDPSAFTSQTRRIIGNVFEGMHTDMPDRLTAGVNVAGAVNRSIDVYHNLVDSRATTDNWAMGFNNSEIYALPGYQFNAFYNVVRNMPAAHGGGFAFSFFNDPYLDEGCNLFVDLGQDPPCNLGCAGSDVDVDTQGLPIDFRKFRFPVKCRPPDRSLAWGGGAGPLQIGIQTFATFHPAVLRLMDPAAFAWKAQQGSPAHAGHERRLR